MCKYDMKIQRFTRNSLNQKKKNKKNPACQYIKVDFWASSKMTWFTFNPPNILLACVSFHFGPQRKSCFIKSECSRPGECRCVCHHCAFFGLMLMIRIMQTNSIYCFVIFIWRMKLIYHPQFNLINYWPIVSDVEPLGSGFQCTVNM